MAEINTGGGDAQKGKPKKQNLRVDFTPMVDMNLLLLTFFMFCTTLSKPQTMDIVLPTKDKKDTPEELQSQVKESTAITLILGENNVMYHYEGKPNFEDYTSLKEIDYSPNGLRALMLQRNKDVIEKMEELKIKRARNQISQEVFDTEAEAVKKNAKDAPVVIIKPTNGSTYKNLVDVLDEMQICSVNKYAVVEMADADNFLVQNYLEKGALTAQAPKQ